MTKKKITEILKEYTDISKVLYADVSKSHFTFTFIDENNILKTHFFPYVSDNIGDVNIRTYIKKPLKIKIKLKIEGYYNKNGVILYYINEKVNSNWNALILISNMIIPAQENDYIIDYTDENFNLIDEL